MASKKILVQLDIQAASNLTSPLSGFVGFSAKADGLYQKIGTAPELRLLTSADVQNAILADGSITGAVSQAQIFTMGVKLYNLTQGYIPYASGATKLLSNSPIYTDGTNVRVGTNLSNSDLSVFGNLKVFGNGIFLTTSGTYGSFNNTSYSDTAWQGPRIGFIRYRGVSAAALPVASGDTVGWFDYFGYDGVNIIRVAQFSVGVDGAVSTGIIPGKFTILTANLAGINTVRLTAYANDNISMANNGGCVGIGTTTPGKKLSVGLAAAANGVDGDILSSALATGTGYGSSMIWNMYVAGGNANSILAKIQPSIYQPTRSYLNSLDFFVGDWNNNNDAGTSKMTIQSGGNVGIGTPAPNQQLEITKNFRLPSTTGTTPYGIIYKGTTPFIHDFNYGNNGTATTVGRNTFVGLNAGNLTMGSTATIAGLASYNTGIGDGALKSITTGANNTAIGTSSLYYNTTGSSNTGVGYYSLVQNTVGIQNTAIGYNSLEKNVAGSNSVAIGFESQRFANSTTTSWSNTNTSVGFQALRGGTDASLNTGNFNSAFGHQSLLNNTTGLYNTAIGYQALINNTIGSGNTALGLGAGRYLADGTIGRITGNNGLYLGLNSKASTDGTNNEIVIGYNAIGAGSNKTVIGNSSVTDTYFGSSTGSSKLWASALNLSGLTASKVVFTDSSKNLTSTGIGTAAQFIKGDGSLDSNTYITSGSISGFVPYVGATENVQLDSYNLYCNLMSSKAAYIGSVQIVTDYINEGELGIYTDKQLKLATYNSDGLYYSYGNDKLKVSEAGDVSIDKALFVGNQNPSSYTDGGYFNITTPQSSYAGFGFYSKDTSNDFGVVQITANPEEGINLHARTNDNSSNSYLDVRGWELGFYTNSQKRLEIAQSGSINAFGNTITSTGGFIGNASTATKLQTARTITIGSKSLSFDGTQNLSYTLNDIGYSHTRIGSNTYSYLSGDIILRGSGKIFVNQMGQFITVNSYDYTKEDVGLSNVTNNAQWHNGDHPTTIAGYGITDALTVSGLTTHNIPKWNGTTFVNSPLMTDSVNSYVYTNVLFVSNVALAAPNISLTDNLSNTGQSYIGYDRFTENSNILLIGAGYDQGYISILPDNEDGLNVMVGSMSGARDLYVTGGTSTSSIALRSGAVTGYYLKCVNTNGVAEWSPVTASQIYKGTWNASTNTPYLSNGSGTAGWYYRVTTAGTFNSVTYSVGDDIIYNGSIWERIPGAGYSLQTATTTVLGGVKIDGTSVKLNASNQLYVSTNYEAPLTFTNGLSRTGNTVSFSSSLSGFVPYSGATMNVDLGSRRLTVNNICVTLGSGSGRFLMDVTGQGHAAWSNLPVASSTVIGAVKVGYGLYVNVDTGSLAVDTMYFVPYTGATKDVNLGSRSIYAYDFILYSDINLKCNIESIPKHRIDIDYKQFEYKTNEGEKRYGVIAQELLSIAPEFVVKNGDYYAVKYTDLLVYEIVQLKEEIKELKSMLCR